MVKVWLRRNRYSPCIC